MTLTFGSVFAGIGGIDLGLERAGMRCLWQIEQDAYASAVLAKHWPDVKRYGDVREVEGSELERVDLIAGGVPCQPWSIAGRRGGQSDDRDMWPEFMRLVRSVRPRFAVVEEVSAWAVANGIGRALGNLAEAGFDAEWATIPASDLGAPHERERVYLVAYSVQPGLPRHLAWSRIPVAASASQSERGNSVAGTWQGLALDSPVLPMADGVSVAVARRMLKPIGNAVVPQVAEAVGRMILEAIR